MSEQPTEQIPHQFVIDELQNQLNTKTAELVVALARIRTRDERIARLEHDLALHSKHHPRPADSGGGGVGFEAVEG